MEVLNIAFYRFVGLNDLLQQRKLFRESCQTLHLKGSVLLSSEGINGCLAGAQTPIRQFQSWLETLPYGKSLNYKESYSEQIPFQKLLIKIKKEIIPLGDPNIQPAEFTSARISPRELKQWFDEKRDFEILDTRNDYEIQFGTFKKARQLGLRHFRQFPEKLKTLPEETRKKPLVMFCTGGIRCEKAAAVALKGGYREVFQLDGGILNYFKECGDSHYEGDCFVFDERVALNHRLEPKADTNLALGDGRRKLGDAANQSLE